MAPTIEVVHGIRNRRPTEAGQLQLERSVAKASDAPWHSTLAMIGPCADFGSRGHYTSSQ